MTKFIHVRRSDDIGDVYPMGGFTVAYDFDPEKRRATYHVAHCNPKEHYNKKVGRQVSGGKLAKYGGPRVEVPEGEKVVDMVLRTVFMNGDN